MSSERRPDIDELLSLVDAPGPLPAGVEDELWASTAELYAELVDRSESRPPRVDTNNVIELAAGGVSDARARSRRHRRVGVWLGAAAAVALIVAGVLVAGSLRGDDAPVLPADETAIDWVRSATSSNRTLRTRVFEADALRIRTIDLGLSSLGDYLETVADAASSANSALVEPPAGVAPEATAHRSALAAWSSSARRLRDDMLADSDSFVFDVALLDARVSEIRSLEEQALDVTCSALRTAIRRIEPFAPQATQPDPFECDVISTSLEPPPGREQP